MAEQKNAPAPQEEQSLSELLQIRRAKLKELQNAGQDPFQITKYHVTAHSADIKADFEAMEGKTVSVAGRLMSKRGMGKAVFCDMQDGKGRIQLYVRIDELGEAAFAKFKKLDIGDIVGVEGEVFKTKRGEISVKAHAVTLLSKSLRPLPEKFHGLTDKETRYRQRYVDLIMNEDVRRAFEIRTKFIKHVRSYLDARDYLEVETPVLNTISGGATARPFITHHNTLDIDMYMRIATELHLKRLVVGGFERVYEIGRIFRNEGMDPKHNPEFTSIELYEAYADFHDMMDIAEGILSSAAVAAARAKGIDMDGVEQTWGRALYECFDQRVEENLIQPTFITMYPVEVSPLTKRSPSDPRLTERFEFFINHSEFGNAFSELNDPIDQKGRFQHEIALREAGDDEAGMMDDDYINALEYGLPPTGGMGIGIDRCVMLLTNSDSIRDVILFPTMKPLD